MDNKIRLIYPIGYEITAEELEDGQWRLHYMEKFSEANPTVAKETAEKLKYLLPADANIETWIDRIIITVVAPRHTILSILAGEFLFVSSLGMMTLNELLATVMLQIAEAKESRKEGENG